MQQDMGDPPELETETALVAHGSDDHQVGAHRGVQQDTVCRALHRPGSDLDVWVFPHGLAQRLVEVRRDPLAVSLIRAVRRQGTVHVLMVRTAPGPYRGEGTATRLGLTDGEPYGARAFGLVAEAHHDRAVGPLAVGSAPRTTTTGHKARAATARLTEPSSSPATSPLPRSPTTRANASLAVRSRADTASSGTVSPVTLTPGARSLARSAQEATMCSAITSPAGRPVEKDGTVRS